MTIGYTRTYSPQAVDRDGVAQAQQLADAGNLTLNGALVSGGVATFTTPARVSIYSAGNLSAVNFTVTGTDRYGVAQSETLAGPNNTTVQTSNNFATITQVAASAPVGSNVEVGSAANSETEWVNVDPRGSTVVAVILSAGAVVSYTLQITYENVLERAAVTAFNDATMIGKVATSDTKIDKPFTALRLVFSGFSTGTVNLVILQEL